MCSEFEEKWQDCFSTNNLWEFKKGTMISAAKQVEDLQDQGRFFWSQTGLVLRLMVSDHITDTR